MHLDDERIELLLQRLDHPAPPISAQAIIDRAELESDRDRGLDDTPRMRWAAGFLVALGIVAAVAYAIPGSPVRAWVAAVQTWVGHRTSAAPAPTAPHDVGLAGISVPPGDAFVIEFTSPQSGGEVTIALTDDAEIGARARNGSATFSSDPDRLVIDNHGSSTTYEVRIPRGAPRVEVRLGETSLYLKEGDRVTSSGRTD